MSTVAIVMATYNGEKYIREQIDSILSSTHQDFELFIYDDGSKDSTVSIINEYQTNSPSQIHVFQNEVNLGLTTNFLRALCRTSANYVMFCDQDDFWKPTKIELTLKHMKQVEEQVGQHIPVAVFTDAFVADQDLAVIEESFFESTHLDPMMTDLPHLLMENKLIGCTVMINGELRRIIQENPFPQKAKYHDWWVALIASSMGRLYFINESTLYYRQHSGNIVGGTGFLSYVKNRVSSLHKQREAVRSLCDQAGEFLNIYKALLSPEKLKMIRTFAELEEYGFIKKRMIILRNGYLKTGILRNIGLIIIV